METYSRYNSFVICPFNNSHRIQEGVRFQRHLIECEKDYPNVTEVICPFNSTHRVKKIELKHHVSTCPNSGDVIRQIVTVKNERKFEPPVLGPSYESLQENATTSYDENWDDDLPAASVPINRGNRNCNLQILNSDRLSGLKRSAKKMITKKLGQGEDINDSLKSGLDLDY
uniref:CHHC U11-48K-type domain-containing protein n=1 Tax=Strigamia maritima TaxID=126957 RepID=T1IXU3_STRMM